MPPRKLKVEVFDENGNKYTFSFEGYITREKVDQLLDLVEIIGCGGEEIFRANRGLSKFAKVVQLIYRKFPVSWFVSRELKNAYESIYNEPIKLSTISTYLLRLVERDMLIREKIGGEWKYKLNRPVIKELVAVEKRRG